MKHAVITETAFNTSLDSPAKPRRGPIHKALVLFSAAYFVGALVTDLAYWQTAAVLWETFSDWLITAGLVTTGLAVVAFDYAAARKHIVHGHNGLVAQRGDEIAFRRHTLRLVSASHDMRKLRQRARQTAECLSWSKAFDQLETSLVELTGTRARVMPDGAPAAAATD